MSSEPATFKDLERLEAAIKDDQQRLEAAHRDHEERLRAAKEGITSLENKWIVTKALTSLLGLTGAAIIGFVFYVNSRVGAAKKDVEDEVTTGIEAVSTAIQAGKDDISKTIGREKLTLLPPGTIVPFAGTTIPDGWLACNGDALSSKDNNGKYAQLFAAIGTAWGDGTSHPEMRADFNVPDLRGRFVRGVDPDGTVDRDAELRESSAKGGNRGKRVGSAQTYATARPTRVNFEIVEDGAHSHELVAATELGGKTGATPMISHHGHEGKTTTYKTALDGKHGHKLSGGDTETRPVNVYVTYIIKY
jgi:microcystin-dependent protein